MKRAARYGIYGLAALVVLAAAAVFLLPRLLDRPRMAAEIQAKLSHAVQGEVRWQEFRVRILPAPHGELRGLHVETAAATLTAEEVTVALRLWPLFFGRAEIASLELARPSLSLTVVPQASVPEEAKLKPAQDALATYRSIFSALTQALQEFAPDTVVAIEDATVKVSVEGVPPLEVSKLGLRARTASEGVELGAEASSPYWSEMKLAGRIRYADLASTAELHLARVQGKAWLDWLLKPAGIGVELPEVDLDIRFRGDPAKALEAEVAGTAKTLAVTRGRQRMAAAPVVLKAAVVADASQVLLKVGEFALGATSLADGALSYVSKDRSLDGDVGFRVDLTQALGYAREFSPLEVVEGASGSLRGRLKPALRGEDWRVGVSVEQSDAAVQLKGVPGPVRLTRAVVDADARGVQAQGVAVSLAAGELHVTSARYAFKDGAAAAKAEFDLGLDETLALVRSAAPNVDLSVVESASGRAKGTASAELARKTWSATADLASSDAQAKLKPLPAPVSLSRATVRATPKAVTVERADAQLMDASVSAAATIAGSNIRGSVGQATVGPKLLAWVWQTAKIPAAFELKAPIRVTVPELALGPKQAMELRAEARFEAGPSVALDLRWTPESLDVRRATVKDARSDVTVTVRTKGSVIDGSYAGRLDSRTIGALLKSAAAPAGAVSGKLRFTYDRNDPRAIQADGRLEGEGIDLTWLAGKPAKLERLDVAADAAGIHVGEATLDWAGQRASLRGEARRTPEGPVVDATIDSPGIVVDALLPKKTPEPAPPAAKSTLFPLPVTGRIALRSKFVKYETYNVEPLAAIVHLERERARLEVTEALVCGLALPLTLDATPSGYAARAVIAAQQQKLEDTAKCLSQENLLLTGPMDLRVDVRTQGQPDALLANLTGNVSADVRNGTVTKFALLGNILSMQNVAALAKDGGPKLGAESFPFRQLSAKGHFDKGRFYIDEGVFHSNAIGLGANGWISLTDYQSNLTVLVAPLALVDEAVRKLPLLGYVVGGTFTSLPVAVTGDIRDPRVVPLGPRAITSEMMGLLSRTLSLPGRVVPGKD